LGVQVPQLYVVPLRLHDWPFGHAPQLIAWPQSLTTIPHVSPSCAHVLPGTTHCLVVALQMCVASQPPQSTVLPQPSGYTPQVAPSDTQVAHVGPPPAPPPVLPELFELVLDPLDAVLPELEAPPAPAPAPPLPPAPLDDVEACAPWPLAPLPAPPLPLLPHAQTTAASAVTSALRTATCESLWRGRERGEGSGAGAMYMFEPP
jgi:hypothetical protein